MSRLLSCIAGFGLILGLFIYAGSTHPGNELGPQHWRRVRGGDQNSARCNGRCDKLAGVYLGCTKSGGDCQQCAFDISGPVPSPAYFLGNPGDPECTAKGNYTETQSAVDCGTIWTGICVVDSGSPTGFTCISIDTSLECTQGIFVITDQL